MGFTVGQILYQCKSCGQWTRGHFAGRPGDVTLEELNAYFRGITGRPAAGTMQPAPGLGTSVPPRPDRLVYSEGMSKDEPEPYSGGSCEACNAAEVAQHRERLARLRHAAGGDPDDGDAGEGEGGEESGT